MPVTGWDSLALRAATIEWQGEGTGMALVAVLGFDLFLVTPCSPYLPPFALMCNLGTVPLAQ